MKKAYKTPKARMIDFTYDEQVTATSPGGGTGLQGSKNTLDLCQQSSNLCTRFWSSDRPDAECRETASEWSLRP